MNTTENEARLRAENERLRNERELQLGMWNHYWQEEREKLLAEIARLKQAAPEPEKHPAEKALDEWRATLPTINFGECYYRNCAFHAWKAALLHAKEKLCEPTGYLPITNAIAVDAMQQRLQKAADSIPTNSH